MWLILLLLTGQNLNLKSMGPSPFLHPDCFLEVLKEQQQLPSNYIGTKTFLLQGNHNFTKLMHCIRYAQTNKQMRPIWPWKKKTISFAQGASPQAMNPYKCAHQQKTLVSKPKGVWQLCPQFSSSPLVRNIPFFIAKFFRDYLIYCLTYHGLTYVFYIETPFPKHPKSLVVKLNGQILVLVLFNLWRFGTTGLASSIERKG